MQEFRIDDKDKFRKVPLWGIYYKKASTLAIRIEGPFRVETAEGWLDCPDGYLALDSQGRPYPIEAVEFERIYLKEASIAGRCLFVGEGLPCK